MAKEIGLKEAWLRQQRENRIDKAARDADLPDKLRAKISQIKPKPKKAKKKVKK